MASLTDFYERTAEWQAAENVWHIGVRLNPEHPVYEGHFPGRPIAPGAALTQMVLDEVDRLTNGRTVVELRQVKFLSVINPTVVSQLELHIECKERGDAEMFTCVGRAGTTNYFKLHGIFS